MQRLKSNTKKVLSIFLCLALLLGAGIKLSLPSSVQAAGIDIGTNPKPPVDIAVSVPNDYPGTFLDFKEELTQKLLAQGMPAGSFRITDTAVKIDTTDLSGWQVYDHYRDSGTYNAIVPAEQRAAQPYRGADNSCTNGTGSIESYFKNNTNTTGNTCKNFDRHIYSSTDSEGKASMVFAGYGTTALSDFMIYPATSDSRRTFSFDINPAVIDTHTLGSYGFFLNAGIKNNVLSGYALIFANNHVGTIQKINNLTVTTANNAAQTIGGTTIQSNISMGITSGQVARLTVELNKNSVTIQCQNYDSNGNLGAPRDLVKNLHLDDTGYNGFGPLVNYLSHGCSSLSIMKYSDLEMTYDSSAFDALKTTQYYEGADQKYFINLTGDSADPQIPDATDPSFKDGINRMNENEIFYISNADDGKILKDPTDDTVGLGSENGYIANGDNYTELIAQYIYNNYIEGAKFKKNKINSELPLANFYLTDASTGDQLMTVHLQHLVNAKIYNESHPDEKVQDYIDVGFVDKSIPGTLAGEDGKIAKWRGKVIDPSNNVVYDSNWQTDPSKISTYRFMPESASGKWTFELSVQDQNGNESKASQTYLVAFLDDKMPNITGENTGRNKATITLTDTGMGIDDDGITFIEDNRGSGVAAYWVTNDMSATPTEDDWITLDQIQHSYSFDVDVESTEPLVVFVRDECGNQGSKAVFQPTHVIVKDPEGNELDDYYVIGDKPIIVLPDDPDVPDGEDGDFSGWVTDDDNEDPITPGSTPDIPDDNTIVIKPDFTKDKAKLVYLGNGGTFTDGADQVEEEVPSRSSIMAKTNAFASVPTRTGYTFTGWKLLKDTNTANLNNTEEIKDQTAVCVKDDTGNITRDTYYLVAQWEIGKHRVNLDPNGGSYGNVSYIDDVAYGTNVGTLAIPTSGRGIPTRNGYIFMGWSATKNSADNYSNAFKAADGQNPGSLVTAPTVGDEDITVYAMWRKDTTKFVVSFDSNGGSTVKAQAYLANDAKVTKYDAFMKPSKAGYTFDGWYLPSDTEFKTEYKGGEAFVQKTDHVFVAKWNANTDTKYTVDYYINSGNKDAYGNYIYTKVNDEGVSKNHTAATESTVSVLAEEKIPELTTGGEKYWFNEELANNVFTGQVTGNPTLSLKLYYDRYFDVKVTSNSSNGTLNSALDQKEGSRPSVSWKAADGYHVSKVMVDGKLRDDLLTTDGYTFEADIHEDHNVYVVFVSDKEETKPDPVPGGDEPDTPDIKFYQISTSIVGCTDGTCTITDTRRIQAGEDANVEWTLGEGYSVTGITVDGIEYSDLSATSIDFRSLRSNHSVVVNVTKMPTIGGGQTEGQYTVTVNRYGGDEYSSVSNSATVERNDKYVLSWNAGQNNNLYKIYINGVEQTGTLFTKDLGSKSYTVKENMVIDVYFADKPDPADPNPEPVVPTYPEDEYIKVTTQIVGGPGEITGGAVLKSDSDYNVEWTTNDNRALGGEDPDYTYYEVVDIIVNGESQGQEIDNLELKNLTEDAEVVVKIAPVFYDIDLYKYGSGSISASKTVYKGQSYLNIEATPDAGYSITKIIVDGTPVLYTQWVPAASGASYSVESLDTSVVSQPEDVIDEVQSESSIISDEEFADDQPMAMMSMAPMAVTNDISASDLPADDGIAPQAEDEIVPYEGETEEGSYQIVTDPGLVTKQDIALNNLSGNQFTMAVNGAIEDHVVEVFFTKNTDEGTVTPAPDPENDENIVTVSASVQGGPGQITSGQGYYEVGSDGSVSWTVPNGYTVESVTVNGAPVEVSGNAWNFEDIAEDKDVVVTLKKNGADNDPMPPSYKAKTFNIDTEIVGGAGTITNSQSVAEGNTKEIKWEVTPVEGHNYEVKYVIVDGVVRTDLLTETSVTLLADQDHKVVVVIDDKVPTNIDKDGDGEPDINIDKDGDGEPDVNVDKDGDGEPDINKDTDGDGEPDVDIDTDGDGEPDVNVDTDGDGEPDINIDTDKDGEPDINIDTDKDGKPDVNIDTDGDGKPDVNVDTNGDGKPDVNIDTDGDGKPDIKIDANGNGIPDEEENKASGGSAGIVAPNTGDTNSNPLIWLIIAVSMLGAICVLAVRQRKNRVK